MSIEEPLRNRIAKNYRHLKKWAKREQVGNLRLYDKDIPEYPAVIELYRLYPSPQLALAAPPTAWDRTIPACPGTDDGGSWQIVAWLDEHYDKKGSPEALIPTIELALEGLNIESFHVKHRGHRAGGTRALGAVAERVNLLESRWLREDELIFEVNPESHHDLGLFLDHRKARRYVAQNSAGKLVLNLFAYTGSFSCHAAWGGAEVVTTVDMSATYLAWAERNLQINRLKPGILVREDVDRWLEAAIARRHQYDLIICDPPTFSNSKKMANTFDIQRDHVRLLERCQALLRPGGTLVFSTNQRQFKMQALQFSDMTSQSRSEDFPRSGHHCWKFVAQDSRPPGPEL